MDTPTMKDIEAAQATATKAQELASAAQTAVNKLLEVYKATRARVLKLFAVDIELKDGERYGGAILNEDGTIHHHVVLLPGETEGDWEECKAWAANLGGSLPDRREQSLLIANLKACFGAFWYWSSEALNDRSAWYQHFDYGRQYGLGKSAQLRGRAVRRVFP